ncbi:putative RNA-directed DNA polymerase [Tanacetum coccineum]
MHADDTLIDNNYADWSQEMMNFLFAKNKVGFINGSIKKPENMVADYMFWKLCDAMVKGWLTMAMEKDIRNSVKYVSSASEIWNDLLERLGKESAPRSYELKQILTGMQQAGASVSSYYTKLRGLWDELEMVMLYEFLMGLDNKFAVIRTQILAIDPFPKLRNAYHLVVEDERKRAISSEKKTTVDSAAFKTFSHDRKETNTNQQRDKTIIRDNKHNETSEICSECGKEGHTGQGCFKLIGYPEWWPRNN